MSLSKSCRWKAWRLGVLVLVSLLAPQAVTAVCDCPAKALPRYTFVSVTFYYICILYYVFIMLVHVHTSGP